MIYLLWQPLIILKSSQSLLDVCSKPYRSEPTKMERLGAWKTQTSETTDQIVGRYHRRDDSGATGQEVKQTGWLVQFKATLAQIRRLLESCWKLQSPFGPFTHVLRLDLVEFIMRLIYFSLHTERYVSAHWKY